MNNEWTDEADLHKSNHHLSCETVGFLVKNATAKNPVFVIASSRSLGEDGKYEYNAITKIPKGWVKEITNYFEEKDDK